jgi:hypothetical protein
MDRKIDLVEAEWEQDMNHQGQSWGWRSGGAVPSPSWCHTSRVQRRWARQRG